MEEIELRKLILKGEDSGLQLKELLDTQDKLAKQIVAFLNKRGGRILIGVSDDPKVTGLTPEQISKANEMIGNCTEHSVVPKITVDTENVVTSDGVVIVVTIPEGIDKPYQTNKGGFYVRTGADIRHVTNRDELRRLFQVGSHVYAEKQSIPGSSLSNLNLKSYRNYLEERFREDADEPDDELIEQMRTIHLVQEDRLTLAGCLLFAKQPQDLLPEFAAKAIWYEGTDPTGSRFHDDRHIEGTLPEMYEELLTFLKAWNQRKQSEGDSFNDSGEPLVPPAVFEEILTNALVHRDYFLKDKVRVLIFDDRIEIISPGTLPNSLTIEEAQQGISRSRNPILERIGLTLMQYKGHGTGLRRAAKLYPTIQFHNDLDANRFQVTLPLKNPHAPQ
ncbi:RNA-binding domain-containing protein [Verrucomicrobiales bacterium BCK34]|nr:RNA-binding domain-containing protein [Verrucomicrobiales bacterium BCK34]